MPQVLLHLFTLEGFIESLFWHPNSYANKMENVLTNHSYTQVHTKVSVNTCRRIKKH